MKAPPIISVLLPTVRPNQAANAMASIPAAAGQVRYEVIVVADFGPDDYPNTKWVLSERKGPIHAVDLAYKASQGEFIFVFNDESRLEPGALSSLYYAALANPRRILTPHHVPVFTFTKYRRFYAPFPFVRRDVIEELGGLFDTSYKAFYADPDLSMRAHAKSIPVEEVGSAVIIHRHVSCEWKRHNWDTHSNNDRATFRTRWDHLGEFHE